MVQPQGSETGKGLAAKHILDMVGDAARPHAGLPLTGQGLEALPGKLGLATGIANALGWMKHGRAHVVAQGHRHGPIYKWQFFNWPAVFVTEPAGAACPVCWT